MKKLFSLLIVLFGVVLFTNNSYAADLDRIRNFVVTVDPRMNDGSLDITYEITWRVLDSTTEGPLSWVKIGTPNENFNTPTALTNNIKSIEKYSGAYVRIDFKKEYNAGEEVTFKYSINQRNIHEVSGKDVTYKFTPAWFTYAFVDKVTIKWNADAVKDNDSISKDGNYLVWTKSGLSKGEKLTATIKYEESSFSNLTSYNNVSNKTSVNGDEIIFGIANTGTIILIIVMLIVCFTGGGGGGYYSHRGFYGGSRYYSSCVRSCACACACARSCACACAGSGRAGCSKKDFYGTKLSIKKINKVIEDNRNTIL